LQESCDIQERSKKRQQSTLQITQSKIRNHDDFESGCETKGGLIQKEMQH
jgi:hypothetical protein